MNALFIMNCLYNYSEVKQSRMKKYLYLILLLVISWNNGICQYRLISDKISGKKLSLIVDLNPVNLLTYDIKHKKINKFGYIDESKPGQMALPSKSIFIGIPPNAEPTIQYSILKKRLLNNKVGVNPEVFQLNDSTVGYNYHPQNIKKNVIEEAVHLKGYLWDSEALY